MIQGGESKRDYKVRISLAGATNTTSAFSEARFPDRAEL